MHGDESGNSCTRGKPRQRTLARLCAQTLGHFPLKPVISASIGSRSPFQGLKGRSRDHPLAITPPAVPLASFCTQSGTKHLAEYALGRIAVQLERLEARVGAEVEYRFHVAKNVFGLKKMRDRGLSKNTAKST